MLAFIKKIFAAGSKSFRFNNLSLGYYSRRSIILKSFIIKD